MPVCDASLLMTAAAVWKGYGDGLRPWGPPRPWPAPLALPVALHLHKRQHSVEGLGLSVGLSVGLRVGPSVWALWQKMGAFGPQERMFWVQKFQRGVGFPRLR